MSSREEVLCTQMCSPYQPPLLVVLRQVGAGAREVEELPPRAEALQADCWQRLGMRMQR
jgi:hypothetical protein